MAFLTQQLAAAAAAAAEAAVAAAAAIPDSSRRLAYSSFIYQFPPCVGDQRKVPFHHNYRKVGK